MPEASLGSRPDATANEARELADECDRLVATATNPENRALLVKIARLWRDVASREAAVDSGRAIALTERLTPSATAESEALAGTQAEATMLKARARHWRRRALELRHVADEARTIATRSLFARLANNYDGLADQAELTALNLTEVEAV